MPKRPSAGELAVGETLRIDGGSARVRSLRPKPGQHRVYNIEVQTEHVYQVSPLGILVHNQKSHAGGPRPTEVAGVRGFTRHGLNQAINRGVKPGSILDALRNPLKIIIPYE